MEAILLTGNLITGLNTTGIFSTDKVVVMVKYALLVEQLLILNDVKMLIVAL